MESLMRLLVIDDDAFFLSFLEKRLRKGPLSSHLEISVVSSGEAGIAAMAERHFDAVLTDLVMPGAGGHAVLKFSRDASPDTDVLVITADSEIRSAVECLKEGAWDYLTKPVDFAELELKLGRILESRSMKAELERLKTQLGDKREPGWELLLPSEAMAAIRRNVHAVKDSDFPVLLEGESGTGKEVIADAIQRVSPRTSGPYVKVNCAGLVSSLLESEMFGHEKGSFTGASSAKSGKFELADSGTLFLDEIGDLEFGLQAKLLRVLQDGSYERVGGTATRHADVRVIAATNKDLHAESKAGRFREDLYYRLNVIRFWLPPLRDRREDILILATRFLDAFSRKYGKRVHGFSPEASRFLETYAYPGNIRELENAVARAFTMAPGEYIAPGDLPEAMLARDDTVTAGTSPSEAVPDQATSVRPEQPEPGSLGLDIFLLAREKERITEALAAAGGNRSEAARVLGISRRRLYERLTLHGIEKRLH